MIRGQDYPVPACRDDIVIKCNHIDKLSIICYTFKSNNLNKKTKKRRIKTVAAETFPTGNDSYIAPRDDTHVSRTVLKAWANRANKEGGFYDDDFEIPSYTLHEWGDLRKEHDSFRGLGAFELSPELELVLCEEYSSAGNPEDLLYDSNGEYDETAGELIGGLIAAVLKHEARQKLADLARKIGEVHTIDSSENLAVLLEEKEAIENGDYPDSVTSDAIRLLISTPFDKLLSAYKESLEYELPLAIQRRIDSDEFPWTMPGVVDDFEKCEHIKQLFENILGEPRDDHGNRCFDPKPDDVFNVYPLLGLGGFSEEDQALVGKQDGLHQRGFTRQELKDAGVFFVNSIGDGEQPVFGVPIPDDTQEDGLFHAEKRAFLTEDEFKKIYEYQIKMLAESGIDLDTLDIPDIQRSLIMVCQGKPNSESVQVIKRGSRERGADGDKLRSPYVDSGFYVGQGVGVLLFFDDGSGNGTGYHGRINTTSIVLLNGHPNYPGVSEMSSTDRVAWDQLYIGLIKILKEGILAPKPTSQEALAAITSGGTTRREECWQGA